MMLRCFSVLLMVQLVTLGVSSGTPSCHLKSTHQESAYKDGDILIGGILQRSLYNGLFYKVDFTQSHPPWLCISTATNLFVQFAGFISAIEEINRNPDILPNHTLGYQIFDSCSSLMKSLQSAMSVLSSRREQIPNYRCSKKGRFVGIVGDLSSETSHAIAQLIGMYRFPQVSFGALDPKFSDKMRYPSFYRTVPNEFSYFAGIAHLLRHFGWTWVGVVVSEDDSGDQALKEIKKAVAQSGGCVDFEYMVLTELNIYQDSKMSMLFEAVRKSTAQVYIIYSSTATIENMFMYDVWISMTHKVWIASPAMNFMPPRNKQILNGSLMFSIKKGEMLGFQDFLYEVNPSKFPNDTIVAYIWQNELNRNLTWHLPKNGSSVYLGKNTFLSLDTSAYRFVYNIYTAVYALAHALHAMISSDQGPQNTTPDWGLNEEDAPWKLNVFLKKTHFTTPAGEEFYFENTGEPPGKYDILNNVNYGTGKRINLKVGSFDPSAPRHHQFLINDSAIIWHSEGNNTTQNLTSVCTQSCSPGYRKVPLENRPICCFACAPCAEGEFANSTDIENCMKCREDQWPNMEKDGCIPRTIVFLSYSDPLGLFLTSAATIFFLTTAGVLGIFIRHRDTPIVKANNQTLSYTLLVSLMLTFLSSLLFIGRPAAFACLIQQAAFGIIFTVAVSCILAKTVTVVVAFKATKPGSRVGRWLGPRMSGSMVAMCALGEVVICLSWLLISPPHPRADTGSETGKVILLCDHGLTTAFYIMIGYMGLLAIVSFIVAFLARNLPDRFNEANLITFSMLVFCSVWVSFIPAYLSTKGRYMVAVEIFAILASSAGLLGCIFLPKCYIIFLRPNLNTRENITVKIHI